VVLLPVWGALNDLPCNGEVAPKKKAAPFGTALAASIKKQPYSLFSI
jgi:hypothetical protein